MRGANKKQLDHMTLHPGAGTDGIDEEQYNIQLLSCLVLTSPNPPQSYNLP